MSKLFCTKHDYIETHSDPHGIYRAFKICANCNHAETLMWNYMKDREEWVTGLFISPKKEATIIASDISDYASALVKCREVAPDWDYYPLIVSSDFDRMAGKNYIQYFLADRWMESEILYDPRTRKLLSLHHI